MIAGAYGCLFAVGMDNDMSFDDYDDFSWRPDIPEGLMFSIVKDAKKKTTKDLLKFKETLGSYDDLVDMAYEHNKEVVKQESRGPFVLFLSGWNLYRGESKDEKNSRIVANFLRHKISPYDAVLSSTLDVWWVPREFFSLLWKGVMSDIVRVFPEVKSAYRNGLIAKANYEEYRDTDCFIDSETGKTVNNFWENYIVPANKDYFSVLTED